MCAWWWSSILVKASCSSRARLTCLCGRCNSDNSGAASNDDVEINYNSTKKRYRLRGTSLSRVRSFRTPHTPQMSWCWCCATPGPERRRRKRPVSARALRRRVNTSFLPPSVGGATITTFRTDCLPRQQPGRGSAAAPSVAFVRRSRNYVSVQGDRRDLMMAVSGGSGHGDERYSVGNLPETAANVVSVRF